MQKLNHQEKELQQYLQLILMNAGHISRNFIAWQTLAMLQTTSIYAPGGRLLIQMNLNACHQLIAARYKHVLITDTRFIVNIIHAVLTKIADGNRH